MRYNLKINTSLLLSINSKNVLFLLPFLIVMFPYAPLRGATLKVQTSEAYDLYIKNVETELEARWNGTLPYFFVSASPGNMISLSNDLTVLRNLYEKDETPKGIIHDWICATMLRGISLDQVLVILRDVEQHPEIFKEVVFAEALNRSDTMVESNMRFSIKGLMTVVTESHQRSDIIRQSASRTQIMCRSLKINEINNYGSENEKLLPEGRDRGLMWKLNSYISLEETEEGVLIECRSIQLTRDLPFGISLFLGPFIKKLPPESLESMLLALKDYFSDKALSPPAHEMAQ